MKQTKSNRTKHKTKPAPPRLQRLNAYVDAATRKLSDGRVIGSYAVVFVYKKMKSNGQIYEDANTMKWYARVEDEGLQGVNVNVLELKAIEFACNYIERDCDLTIHSDNINAIRMAQSQCRITPEAKETYDKLHHFLLTTQSIVGFFKVDSHSGNHPYHDHADKRAKDALLKYSAQYQMPLDI